jgi:two-component system, cell cycle response regulator CpdR
MVPRNQHTVHSGRIKSLGESILPTILWNSSYNRHNKKTTANAEKGWSQTMSRILLAEDDNDMRRFLAKALENAGHDVVSFDNGKSAYERLREEPFSLLLTDIVMPEMDGIELARRATELDPDLKVMFITGFAAVALNPESDAPKDAKVLSKPFHLKDLVQEVERMLAA